ncbi:MULTISPECIES: MarR family winged helix-turn-helix transcriptional regulator [Actinokineospora]|uniref:MarR family transcriptional regulator n=1 Tax=Actinokineospora fastidiosa TaxID=1816 RepID=A0A918LED8_9PSEU|nr:MULTISPECIES: MarR family transcriptional regulator [Actinokineospora]UVS80381.1 HTH-type transcriptional regulator MhqR [Actinokineospora sp. UTMC 2448]GGS34896.1 MarR family transcriptional regulator [Actinokineospora fastidiosa]
MGDHVDRVLRQWAAERPDLAAAPMGVVGRVQRASRLLERGLTENFARHGLQLWEFDILGTLRRSGPPYRLTAGALSASSMVTSGAITNRIDRLVARGLVTRETDPGNRRSVVITLTESGWTAVEDVLEHHVSHEERALSCLNADEQRELARLLRKLLIGLGDVPGGDAVE